MALPSDSSHAFFIAALVCLDKLYDSHIVALRCEEEPHAA
jgi:hypothetical protein